MGVTMQESRMKELAAELAKGLKTPADLSNFTAQLTKLTVEAALNAEMSYHLGYGKHETKGRNTGNSRNGYTKKTLKGTHGEIELETPRDRDSSFEPCLVEKNQTRITGMDSQILSLYAKGMSTRDIVEAFKEMYDVEVSAGLISQVTNAVIDQVNEWQNRPLDKIYPIVYLDCITLKIRQDKQTINKAIYLALGVNMEGHKELLGMWISINEGAKFWLSVLTELKNRGIEQILIACTDGLTGFPEAINAVYPEAKTQLCIVHMVRNSMRYIVWKDYKLVTADLKLIYQSATEQEALNELKNFEQKWDAKYPQISKSWRNHWHNLNLFFSYPSDIRKVIYTTNAIESLNSVIRKSVKTRKVFPNDNSALKVIYLATQAASKKWTMPVQNWKLAMTRFMIEFKDQLVDYA